MGKSRKPASQSQARRQPSALHALPPPPPPPPLPSILLRCNQEKKWKAVLGTARKVEAPAAMATTVPQEAVAGTSMPKVEKTIRMTTRSKAAAPVASTSHAEDERWRRSRGQAEEEEEEEEERAAKRRKTLRFRLSLSREEIMADFEAITGKKLPSRPKRHHPKAVQENLSVMFPGSNMPQSINANRYKPKKSS
ncbi:uncharacterized protein LOC135605091 [Musa acuminata AAA Group]|uniref:uncharacterized protein LOC135605091 n=1 Tax=Musa acuminata AAA Group TaxID=214697 RepID=UPI0031D072AF